MPLYREALRYSPVEAALLLVFYVAGLVPALLGGAACAARFGARPTIGVGLLAGMAGSIVLAAGAENLTALAIGRVLSGVGIGAAMTAGTGLIRAFVLARGGSDAAGLVRGSMTLTAGLGLGAAVSSGLATWAPMPTAAPFVAHLGVSLAAAVVLVRAGSPVAATTPRGGFALPPGGRRQFAGIVVVSPWVFAAAATAYASVPAAVTTVPSAWRVAYAGTLTLVTLAIGTGVQPLGASLARRLGIRALGCGIAIMIPGFVLAAAVAAHPDPIVGAAAAALLGAGFGVSLVAGLEATRQLVADGGGAGLIGLYYAGIYLGFGLPAIVAATAGERSTGGPLLVVSCLACVTAIGVLAAGARRGGQSA